MTEEGRGRGCLKYGCFGCLGLGATVILVFALIAALALRNSSGSSEWARDELTQELPRVVLPDDPSQATGDELPTPFAPRALEPDQVGRVVLNVKACEFIILPGRSGEPIRVEADYDTQRYALGQKLDTDDDGAWTYHLSFSYRSFLSMFGNQGDHPKVRLYLPPGVPFSLEGVVSMGESDLELGGLWITATDLDLGMGSHALSFDRPSPRPMERFKLDASMGELQVRGLGNASPGEVSVEHSMGEMRLDLRGDWITDSNVQASCSMGECRVTVPRDVAVELDRAHVSLGEKQVLGLRNLPASGEGVPTLHLSVSQSMGELRIES